MTLAEMFADPLAMDALWSLWAGLGVLALASVVAWIPSEDSPLGRRLAAKLRPTRAR
jgi:hypothetical protein